MSETKLSEKTIERMFEQIELMKAKDAKRAGKAPKRRPAKSKFPMRSK